jgi:hypothetical protein
MTTYINNQTGHRYTGGSMTRLVGGVLFSGVPTVEQLTEWGYTLYVPPTPPEPTEDELRAQRMSEIQQELSAMDYLTSKYIDGEDMSQYGDWQARRKALREEYRELEQQLDS